MKNKKLLALLLAGAMSVGCLAGCGQEQAVSTETGKASTETTATVSTQVEEPALFNTGGTLPIVNESVTLKILTQDDANAAWDKAANAGMWEWLEEQTGIHFEVESYTKDELASKLPLIMATPNEMPDIFLRCEFTASDVLSYGQNGQLLMLDDYIEEYGYNIKELFDTVDYAYGAAVSADGHIYSLPAYNNGPAVNKYAFNQTFLDNINMEAPETIEQLYEVFKAIKEHGDANGDGIKGNEFCWSGTLGNFRPSALSMVGINIYYPTEGCLFDATDDEVYFVPTSDAYKYCLEWLNKMYEEGMIDPETFTQGNDEYNTKLKEGRIFLKKAASDPDKSSFNGIAGDFYPEVPVYSEISEPFYVTGAPYQTDIGAISAYTEYPEICVLLLDYFMTEEASIVSRYGLEGVDYKVVSEEPKVIESIIEGHNLGYGSTNILTTRWMREDMIWTTGTDMDKSLWALRDNYGEVAFQNYLKFTDEEAETISIISADLGLYTDDYFVGFITGTYDIEKDWDAYVKACESMKLDELVAVYQKAYNRYYGLD